MKQDGKRSKREDERIPLHYRKENSEKNEMTGFSQAAVLQARSIENRQEGIAFQASSFESLSGAGKQDFHYQSIENPSSCLGIRLQ